MFEQLTIAREAAEAAATSASKAPAKRTTSKAASKAATKAAPVKKNAAKPATKASAKATAKAAPQGIKYAVSDFARPQAGRALAAHTAAFLGLSGMATGDAVPRAFASKVIGARAVQYHTGNGNFEATPDGLKLTEKGEIFFMSRAIDPELLAAYESVMQSGAVNDLANVKTEAARVKV